MRPTVTDRVAWSVGRSLCLSVCRSVTPVSPAKTAKPIEMPFGLRIRVGPGNHVLDVGPDPPWEGAILWGKGTLHCKVEGNSAVPCSKTAESVEMPFGLRARMDRKNHVRWGSSGAKRRCHGNHFFEFLYIGCTLAPPGEYD